MSHEKVSAVERGDSGRHAAETPLVDVSNLSKEFVTKRNAIGMPLKLLQAVEDVSFQLWRGEVLALVGGSGSGKSTTARLISRLERPDMGRILVKGVDWTYLRQFALQKHRRVLQMVFQNPNASLDPSRMVVHLVGEPLMIYENVKGDELDRRVLSLLDAVGLSSNVLHRYPYEFSGGQRQRIAIARALAADPDVIIADEAVSALDVSNQAKILNLLLDLQEQRSLSILFITHDLSVVRQVADRVAVMNEGRIVETATADALFAAPEHDYTKELLESVPVIGRWR